MDELQPDYPEMVFPTENQPQLPYRTICPNGWGRQVYNDEFVDLPIEKQIDVNNHRAKYAFIQDFMITYINGIQLKKEKTYWKDSDNKMRYFSAKRNKKK